MSPLLAALLECLHSTDEALRCPALTIVQRVVSAGECQQWRPWLLRLQPTHWLPGALFSPAAHATAVMIGAALVDSDRDDEVGRRAGEWMTEAQEWWEQVTSCFLTHKQVFVNRPFRIVDSALIFVDFGLKIMTSLFIVSVVDSL
jgi:hypothetical protein